MKLFSNVSRVYLATKREHKVTTGNSNNLNIIVKKENFPDTGKSYIKSLIIDYRLYTRFFRNVR